MDVLPFDAAAARARLMAERDRRRAELGEEIEAPGQMTYGSQAAAATHVFEQQRDLALRERARADLALIEAALARLDDGTFGRCASCGSPIPAGRLEILPWAAECVSCSATRGARRPGAGRGR